MTQRFTAYLVRMGRIQRVDYSTTMHNSDRIFIAACAAHEVTESLINFTPQQAIFESPFLPQSFAGDVADCATVF